MSSGRVVYLNGEFVPENEAKISIYDSALMFGDMVFEMTRSFNKKQFRLHDHLIRLYNSIKGVAIPMKLTIDELEQLCLDTIERNDPVFGPKDEHRLMINVSRGPLSLYAPIFNGKMEVTVVIADFPLKWTVASMGKLYDSGINAVIPSQRAIPAELLDPKIKNRSRLYYQMANIEVSNWKGDNNWALLMDPDGFIAEGTGDNFFIVKDGKLITPEGRNVLRGISREYVFELCAENNISCVEQNIGSYDVYTADEAFMTGTPFCIIPVTQLNNVNIGNGKMGPMTKKLLDLWGANVGVNIVEQIKNFGIECAQEGAHNANAPSPYQFRR